MATMNLMNLTAESFETSEKPRPQRPPDDPPLPPRKRDRKSLNCVPCKRLKVRCDRRQPCSRCVRGKRDEQCVYEPEKKEEAKSRPAPHGSPKKTQGGDTSMAATAATSHEVTGIKPISRFGNKKAGALMKSRDGKTKYLGGTHWGNLIKQFHDIAPFAKKDVGSSFMAVRYELKQLKKAFRQKRTVNYPFGSEQRPLTAEEAIALLPPRPELEKYLNIYLNTFERTHRILHVPTFKEEMSLFWENPEEVDLSWLSQVFMMAAVACFAQHVMEVNSGSPLQPSVTAQVDRLLDGAQGCLTSVKFLYKPKMAVLRTLCVVTIAKQMDLISANESDSCWLFMGVLTRIAIAQGYHRDPVSVDNYGTMPAFDDEMRRRIWCTIVYMELQHALDNGMPLFMQPSDYDCQAPRNINDSDFSRASADPIPTRPMTEVTESTLQIYISRSIPIVMKIVGKLNSANATIPYEEALELDTQIHSEMEEATKAFEASADREYVYAQKMMLEMMYRRLLLVLHRPYFSQMNAKDAYSQSYYAALDSSLALLFLKGDLALTSDSDGRENMAWLAEVMKDEFIDAALTVGVELRRNKSELKAGSMFVERPVETIFATLHACKDIAARQIGLSIYHMKEHVGIGVMLGALESPDNAEAQWLAFEEAAKETIEHGKKALLETSSQGSWPEIPMDSVPDEISPLLSGPESSAGMTPEYYLTKSFENAIDFEVEEYFPAFPLLWSSLGGQH